MNNKAFSKSLTINNHYIFYMEKSLKVEGTVIEVDEYIKLLNLNKSPVFIFRLDLIIAVEQVLPINEQLSRIENINKESENIIKDINNENSRKSLILLQREKKNIEREIVAGSIKYYEPSARKVTYGYPTSFEKPKP